MNEADQLIQVILKTRKYKDLSPEIITRIVNDAVVTQKKKDRLTYIKRKLHQAWGAYYTSRPDFQKLQIKITQQLEQGKSLKEILLPLLSIHASTREREPFLKEFYEKIFAVTGNPASIIDHACGLNALTLPWMQLPATTNYSARDIDLQELLFIKEIFTKINLFQNFSTLSEDLVNPSTDYSDIHFLFKILPLLEQQKKGSSRHLLQKLNGRYLIVSYPTASLSGLPKNMMQTYTSQCEQLIQEEKWHHTRIEFPSELIYIIRK